MPFDKLPQPGLTRRNSVGAKATAIFIATCAAAIAGLAGQAARAGDGSFTSEASFAAAAGGRVSEGFETTATSARALVAISTPLFTVGNDLAPIGVQGGPDSPDAGFGAAATEGSHYLSVYRAQLAQGTLRFDLVTPSTAFGLDLLDLGEAQGSLLLRTNTGAYAGGITLASFNGGLGNGNVQFFGITQTTAFTSVYITVDGLDDAYGVDRVQLSAVPVPEPIAAALWVLGLAGLLISRQGRRNP